DISINAPAVFASAIASDAEGGVVSTAPSDDELDFTWIEPHDNLIDQGADDLLACRDRPARAIPRTVDIAAKSHQPLSFGSTERVLRKASLDIQLPFDVADGPKAIIPTPFEFGCDDPIIRVHRIILAGRTRRFVARLLQSQLKVSALFHLLAAA